MVKKKFPILIFSILFIALSLSTLGAITFQSIYPPTNPFITPLPNVTISTGVHCPDGCSSFTESWNGTNTTLYDSSLVLFMNFDNRSALGENDTFVRDLSLYGNNGSVVGGENITWGAGYGKYNGAFNWNGKKGWINITDSDSLGYNYTSMTWSFWAKKFNYTANEVYLDKYTTTNYFREWKISATGPTTISITASSNGTTGLTTTSGAGCGIDYDWTSISIVYNGTHMIYYKNGNYCDIDVTPLTQIYNGLQHMAIGVAQSAEIYFNGSIDDVMIWNRSLSASEIEYLYRSQVTKYNESYWQYNTTRNTSATSQIGFICSINSTSDNFCSASQTIRKVNNLIVNFSTIKGITQNDFYGVNPSTSNLSDFDKEAILNLNINVITVGLYENGWVNNSNGVYNFTGNSWIENVKKQVEFAHDNNLKVYLIGGSMPSSLQNKTSDCISNNYSCAPLNYTKYAELQLNAIWYYTNGGEWIDSIIAFSPKNEPHATTSIFSDLNSNNYSKRMDVYYEIYNTTRNLIKANSTLSVIPYGGPCGHFGYGTDNVTYIKWDWWFQNFTTNMDFVDLHIYRDNFDLTTQFNSLLQNRLYDNCTTYGGNCSKIYVSEFNVYSDSVRASNSDFYGSQIADFYLNILNQPQNNISLSFYDIRGAIDDKWSMTNETSLTYYPPYNVTKNFAHLCPAGATVYVTSGDDDSIKQVSCKKGNQYSVIVINTGTEAKNITLNMSMTNGTVVYPYANLVNYEDDTTTYKVNDGVAQLGVIDSYEILYLYSGVEGGATLRGVFKLNEGEGNTIYDSLQNLSNGVKSGATWINDSILVTLSAVQYTIDLVTGLLTLDTDYLYEYLFVDYDYNKVFGFHVSILNVIAGFLMIVVLGVGIIYVVKYFKNIKELE